MQGAGFRVQGSGFRVWASWLETSVEGRTSERDEGPARERAEGGSHVVHRVVIDQTRYMSHSQGQILALS